MTMPKFNHFANNTFPVASFASYADADNALFYAMQVAKEYGYISCADLFEICGMSPSYTETKIGWTEQAIKSAKVDKFICQNQSKDFYTIRMPECDWFEDADDSVASIEKAEPINVTIPKDKPEFIKQTITALFENSEKIKDRPVFINIM